LHERKDPLTVVRAFLKFVKTNPVAVLYMIYHTEELLPEITKLLETEPALMHSVKLVGKISPDELEAWYNSSDFYLMGSYYEGTLTALSEAMSCGCIPIVTDIATFRKMTGESLSELLFEPGNEKALLSILMKTPSYDIATMREKVLKQFREQLSFESIAKKIDQVITSL
jgi:glycosyltransferase involved in cell wall biosynthesis